MPVGAEMEPRLSTAEPLHWRKAVLCETPVTPPLISCLCVTRNRVPMLRRAVNCFLDQTYSSRELVVLYESDDSATRDYLAALNDAQICAVEVSIAPKLTLGALRNISVTAGRGEYIANWDDDDWHSPLRLAEQMEAIGSSGKPSCLLMRWVIYDLLNEQAYLSGPRLWEGSLVTRRDAIIDYPELVKGEDKAVVEQLITDDHVVGLDKPHLYVYIVHGSNTWETEHWRKNLLPYAEQLTPESSAKVKALVDQHMTSYG